MAKPKLKLQGPSEGSRDPGVVPMSTQAQTVKPPSEKPGPVTIAIAALSLAASVTFAVLLYLIEAKPGV